eukprot:scaffold4247_cov66-Cylindrotheca_fusiformis.AAC.13
MGQNETNHVFHLKFDLKKDKPVTVATMGYPNGRKHIETDWKNRQIQPLTQLEWDRHRFACTNELKKRQSTEYSTSFRAILGKLNLALARILERAKLTGAALNVRPSVTVLTSREFMDASLIQYGFPLQLPCVGADESGSPELGTKSDTAASQYEYRVRQPQFQHPDPVMAAAATLLFTMPSAAFITLSFHLYGYPSLHFLRFMHHYISTSIVTLCYYQDRHIRVELSCLWLRSLPALRYI